MGPSVYFYLQGLSYCNDYLSVNTDAKGPSVNMESIEEYRTIPNSIQGVTLKKEN